LELVEKHLEKVGKHCLPTFSGRVPEGLGVVGLAVRLLAALRAKAACGFRLKKQAEMETAPSVGRKFGRKYEIIRAVYSSVGEGRRE
jgi:hypothetical protein